MVATKTALTIRPYKNEDLPFLQHIDAKSLSEEVFDESDWQKYTGSFNYLIFVAEENSRPVGFVVTELKDKFFNILKLEGARIDALLDKVKSRVNATTQRSKVVYVCSEHEYEKHILLKSCKFLAKKVLRNAFACQKHDGYVFVFDYKT